MTWADRVVVVWGAVLWGAIALLANGHGHSEVIKAVLLLAGVPWLLLAAGVAAEIWWQTGHHERRRAEPRDRA